MKRKKELIVIFIPILLVLALVIIKSFDKNSFDLSAENVHELSLKQEHILSLSDLKTKLETTENTTLIDLRNQTEFEANHLINALNIPFENILENTKFQDYTKEKGALVLYSESVNKTAKAWVLLTQTGFQNLYILDIPKELFTENIFEADSFPLGNEVLKYKFQPDTLLKPELLN